MDGPNVKLAFHRELSNELQIKLDGKKIISMMEK